MITNNLIKKIMNKDDIWRQIIQFVKEERWDDEYTPETDLVKDLKFNGDDTYDLWFVVCIRRL